MNDDMEKFAKLGSMLWRNGKARMLAREHPHAFAVWTFALSYCAHLLNDGHLTEFDLTGILGASDGDVDALVEARMLDRHDDGSLWVHDFVQAQGRSRADVESTRGKRAEAARRAGLASAQAKAQRKLDNSTEFNELSTEVNDVSTDSNEGSTTFNDVSTDGQRLSTDGQRKSNDSQRTVNTDTDTDTDGKKEKPSVFPKKKTKTRINPKFQPDKASWEHARRLGLDAHRERGRFVDWWLADGGAVGDWQAAFRGWCDRSPDARPPKPPSPPDEAWIQRHVLERLPEDAQLPARRRFFELLRGTGDRERAARSTVGEFS